MFEQTFVQTGKTNKTWTVVLSFFIQILLMGLLVILPMIYFDVLPSATLQSFLVAPPPPPPPPPPPAAAPPKVVKVIPRQFDAGKLVTPKAIPKEIAQIKEEELPPPTSGAAGVVGGVPGGVPGGAMGGVLGGIISNAPAVVPKAATPQRVRVSQGVSQGLLVRQVKPVYPALARQARIQGTVVLQAVISKTGDIEGLHLVSGHPMLAPAAIDAVKQWKYKPYFLNGEPVEVETTINVNFTLAGG